MSESSTSGETSLSTCEFCGAIFNTINEKEEHIRIEHSKDRSQSSMN
jgi:hypothetical protein